MYPKARRFSLSWPIIAIALISIVVGLFITIGIAIEIGVMPNVTALPAGKIPARQIRQLEEMGVTRKDERVLYFYSAAALNIRDDGNLFTNERVVSYEDSGGSLAISDAAYDDIATIDFQPSGSWIDDSTITVTKKDGTSFVLWVSTDSEGDKIFFRKLIEEWNKHKRQRATGEKAQL